MNSTTTEPVPTVMIVEDAPEFVQLVEASLTRDGSYRIEVATNGLDAIDLARKVEPDVVILDLGLPGVDGIEVCREIRTFSDAYILMLTARAEEVDRLVGLAVGADDYVTKPFSARELAARVQVLLRRPRVSKAADDRGAPSDMVEIGAMRIDLPAREVVVDDQPAVLRATERALRKHGFRVTGTTSPFRALELLAEESFDVSVCDVRMPELSGPELMLQARQNGIDVPYLFLTGHVDDETGERIDAPAERVITKPVLPATLAFRIRTLVDSESAAPRNVTGDTVGDL